jgi:hypothetical protein
MNPSIIVDETDLKNLDTILSNPKKLVILFKKIQKKGCHLHWKRISFE